MRFEAVGRSDQGLVRPNNEDSWTASPTLLAVADGVGGRPAGEVASALAVRSVELFHRHRVPVDEAVHSAGELVAAMGAANPLFTGMCSTLTAVAVEDGAVVLAHVGDSKAVLVRADAVAEAVTVLTEAQTIAARMVRMGELTPEQAATHPKRATLYQIIGQQTRLDLERVVLDVAPGDRLVLSTDGLEYADAERVAKLLAAASSPAELADALVAAAIDGGGRDNVTVVVADVVE